METRDNSHFYIVMAKAWIQKDGKFLLARRGEHELHLPGAWSVPGGRVDTEVEEQHVIEKTLQREIEEEVGLKVSEGMELLYNSSFVRSDGNMVLGFTFVCQYLSGEAQALEDTAEVAWYTLDELKQLPGLEEFLKREIKLLEDRK